MVQKLHTSEVSSFTYHFLSTEGKELIVCPTSGKIT